MEHLKVSLDLKFELAMSMVAYFVLGRYVERGNVAGQRAPINNTEYLRKIFTSMPLYERRRLKVEVVIRRIERALPPPVPAACEPSETTRSARMRH